MATIFTCKIEGGGVGVIDDSFRPKTQARRDAAKQQAWDIVYEIAARAAANPDRPGTMGKLYGTKEGGKVESWGTRQDGTIIDTRIKA